MDLWDINGINSSGSQAVVVMTTESHVLVQVISSSYKHEVSLQPVEGAQFSLLYRCCFVFNVFIRQYKNLHNHSVFLLLTQFFETKHILAILSHFYFVIYKQDSICIKNNSFTLIKKKLLSFVSPSPQNAFLKFIVTKYSNCFNLNLQNKLFYFILLGPLFGEETQKNHLIEWPESVIVVNANLVSPFF